MAKTITEVKQTIQKLKAGGFPLEDAKRIVTLMTSGDGLDGDHILSEVELLYKRGPERNLTEEITQWTSVTNGYFPVTDCDRELHIVTSQAKATRRQVMHRLVEAGILERQPQKNGVYRRVEREAQILDWKNADPKNILDIAFPLGLEKLVTMYPGNIAICAGTKSSGKTAFANKFIYLNQNNPDLPQPIYLFTSEGAEEELHKRFANYDIPLDHWTFEARRRSINFADVIVKDHINIIDYLEIRGGEYFLVRDELAKISDALGKGFALVCLQKPFGRDLGLGGQASIERCRLYVAMENSTLTIIDAKNFKGEHSPRGKKFKFKLVKGAEFVNITEVESNEY